MRVVALNVKGKRLMIIKKVRQLSCDGAWLWIERLQVRSLLGSSHPSLRVLDSATRPLDETNKWGHTPSAAGLYQRTHTSFKISSWDSRVYIYIQKKKQQLEVKIVLADQHA